MVRDGLVDFFVFVAFGLGVADEDYSLGDGLVWGSPFGYVLGLYRPVACPWLQSYEISGGLVGCYGREKVGSCSCEGMEDALFVALEAAMFHIGTVCCPEFVALLFIVNCRFGPVSVVSFISERR